MGSKPFDPKFLPLDHLLDGSIVYFELDFNMQMLKNLLR